MSGGTLAQQLSAAFSSLGGSNAPSGAVFDLASTPWQADTPHETIVNVSKADDHSGSNPFDAFGSWVGHAAGDVGGAIGSAISHTNDAVNTAVGAAHNATFDAAGATLSAMGTAANAVDQSLSAFMIAGDHADAVGNFGAMFDSSTWAKAWQIARHQNAGQSFWYNLVGAKGNDDPFAYGTKAVPTADGKIDYQGPFRQTVGNDFPITRAAAGATDFATMWYLDPTVLAGKAASIYRANRYMPALKAGDAVGMLDRLNAGGAPVQKVAGLLPFTTRAGTGARITGWYDHIDGANKLGRPLDSTEIFATSPELRATPEGRTIANLYVQARNITEAGSADRTNLYNKITAIVAGDPEAYHSLVTEQSAGSRSIGDALANMKDGTVGKLQLQAMRPDTLIGPDLNAEFERQLSNLDGSGDVTKFVNDWVDHQNGVNKLANELLSNAGVGDVVPALHPGAVGKGLKILQGERLVDKTADLHDTIMQAAQNFAAKPATSIFQQSLNQMPLMVARSASPLAALVTKGPRAVVDSLRQLQYTGAINLHDWGTANQEFDSYMRLAGVDTATRIKTLSLANAATTEADKMAIVQHIENLGIDTLVKRYAAKGVKDAEGDAIDRGYVLDLIRQGNAGKAGILNQLNGRAYAATQLPEDLANDVLLRKQSMAAAQNKLTLANSRTSLLGNKTPVSGVQWRVDQIPDEYGHPVALPLLESQGTNTIPMIDIHQATSVLQRQAVTTHLRGLGDAYANNAAELGRLQSLIANSSAKDAARLADTIDSLTKAQNMLLDAGTAATRWWKFGVLFRLGYPIRVLMDDHLRIAAKLGTHFYLDNGKEASKAWWDNVSPAWFNSTGRKAEATRAYQAAKGELRGLQLAYGYDKPHTDKEFAAIKSASLTLMTPKATVEDKTAAKSLLDRLDPEGHIREPLQTQAEIDRLGRSITSHRGQLAMHQSALDTVEQKATLGIQVPDELAAAKAGIARHTLKIADRQAAIEHLQNQLRSESPDDIRRQLKLVGDQVAKGGEAFLPPKTQIGDLSVPIEDSDLEAPGAFSGGYGIVAKQALASNPTFTAQAMVTGEQRLYERLAAHGVYTTVAPVAGGHAVPGHLDLWSQVLNQQVGNSRVAMYFVRHPDATVHDFADWIKEPAQQELRDRVPHYAWDPEDWGGRVKALVDDYLPTDEVKAALKDGYVSSSKLDKLIPNPEDRPTVHGQVMDINTGRSSAVQQIAQNAQNIFGWLSEEPTDRLSRHPLFNSIYKSEVAKGAKNFQIAAEKNGTSLTPEDIQAVSMAARKKALNYVRNSLWDITSHSHAAHVLRFLSPFFAAHQEGLTRWWGIAKDDPSVVRRFSMAFDAPRQMGLVINTQTGALVGPDGQGPDIQNHHAIVLKFPDGVGLDWANNAVKAIGGGKTWTVNENSFNVIANGGFFDPGVGPLVTIPITKIAEKYADSSLLGKAAAILNPNPTPGLINSALPATFTKLFALKAGLTGNGQHNQLYARYFQQNISDDMVSFNLAYGRNPTSQEFDAMLTTAGHETNRDLTLMLASNFLSPAPAKPQSKYAAIQHGWMQIRSAMNANGKDFTWALNQFKAKYGDAYLALAYSDSTNPVGLTGTPAEFDAVKKYKPLLDTIDPKVMSMVIGPANAMAPKSERQFSSYAREALANTDLSPFKASEGTFFDNKDLSAGALAPMISQGWTQYASLTDVLDQAAQAVGKTSWSAVPELQQVHAAEVQKLAASNFAWGDAYAKNQSAGDFTTYLEDMRKIAAYKPLANDPVRTDITALKNYLSLRDMFTQVLQYASQHGGSAAPNAVSNERLMAAFKIEVDKINESNTYFHDFAYNQVIARDPYVVAGIAALSAIG